MKLYAKGIYLGMNQRTYKDKTYTNVNIDFDGEICSFSTGDPAPFFNLERYQPFIFQLSYGTYHRQDGREASYMRVDSAEPVK